MEKDISGILPCPNCVCFYCTDKKCPRHCSLAKTNEAYNSGICHDREYECQREDLEDAEPGTILQEHAKTQNDLEVAYQILSDGEKKLLQKLHPLKEEYEEACQTAALDKLQEQYQAICRVYYGSIGIDTTCRLKHNIDGETVLISDPIVIPSDALDLLKGVSIEPDPIELLHSTKHMLDQLVKFDTTKLHQIMKDDPKIQEKAKQLQHWFDGIRSTEDDKSDDPSGFMEDPIV